MACAQSSQVQSSQVESSPTFGMTDKQMFGPVSDRDQDLTFVVFGPTGSGKTTLINYATAKGIEDVNEMKGGIAKVDVDSTTTQILKVLSPKIEKPGSDSGHYTFTFFDTPGHGAKDQAKWHQGSLMESTVKRLFKETGTLNGVILVLKMERFRSDLEDALKEYITLFNMFELDKAAFLVIVTHSLAYTEEIKKQYAQKIAMLFQDHVLEKNVIHVNVSMLPEMIPEFQELYKTAIPRELKTLRETLVANFAKEHNIRHWFDKARGLDKEIEITFGSDPANKKSKGWLPISAKGVVCSMLIVCASLIVYFLMLAHQGQAQPSR